ncbi:MAG: hypothetical protein BWY57_03300 [Betaproteobacteria bacterium ADurb.Bin341]|nr:MAG: hypothetical protein BWY57_03300 [Betaproteobacteria bacterium ADurb.Bin341]
MAKDKAEKMIRRGNGFGDVQGSQDSGKTNRNVEKAVRIVREVKKTKKD